MKALIDTINTRLLYLGLLLAYKCTPVNYRPLFVRYITAFGEECARLGAARRVAVAKGYQ